jgi:hypothetical protein
MQHTLCPCGGDDCGGGLCRATGEPVPRTLCICDDVRCGGGMRILKQHMLTFEGTGTPLGPLVDKDICTEQCRAILAALPWPRICAVNILASISLRIGKSSYEEFTLLSSSESSLCKTAPSPSCPTWRWTKSVSFFESESHLLSLTECRGDSAQRRSARASRIPSTLTCLSRLCSTCSRRTAPSTTTPLS